MASSDEFKLRPHPSIPRSDKPLLICVLDGWGGWPQAGPIRWSSEGPIASMSRQCLV